MGSKSGSMKIAAKRVGLSLDEYTRRIKNGLKRCTKCKEWKERSEFYADNSRGDGLKARCKSCDYKKTTDKPTKDEFRQKAKQGQKWCCACKKWYPTSEIRSSRCLAHKREYDRQRYKTDKKHRLERRQHVYSRKRNVDPIPPEGQEFILDEFDGKCAYCGEQAGTWDHVVPISKGGKTAPWNIVPACRSCNSSKNNQDLAEWIISKGRVINDLVLDRLTLENYPIRNKT